MRRLRKGIEGLIERPPTEVTLRLRVMCIALRINLISTGTEQHRGEQPRDGAQQVRGKIDRVGRGKAQLSCGRLGRVGRPRRRFGARDVLRV